MSKALLHLAQQLSRTSIAVIGVPVLDRYVYGRTHRISREAPVLIVREESQDHALGGAGNTAANLLGLGSSPRLIGPVGEDSESYSLRKVCHSLGLSDHGLVQGTFRVTVTKTRILAGAVNTTRQQMLRVDREDDQPLTPTAEDRIRAAGQAAINQSDAVIISDYGSAHLTPLWTELATYAQKMDRPVIVDSRYALLQFSGVTAVTPNESEVEHALNRRIKTPLDAELAAHELRERLDLEAALITRGQEGMVLSTADGPALHIPAIGGEAKDVTGAGDTVTATFSAAIAVGAPFWRAAKLANRAAAIVVQKKGTYAVSLQELVDELQEAFVPPPRAELRP